MNISIDIQKINQSLNNKKLLKNLIILSALILNLSPLFLKNILNINAKFTLSLSGLIFTLCCLRLPDTDYEEKMLNTFKNTNLKFHKTILAGEILKIQTELEIENQKNLAQSIEYLPRNYIDYFADKYGVAQLIQNENINNPVDEILPENNTLNIPKSIFETTIAKAEIESNSNLDWMNKAINSSCFLAGKKRSGKTFLMKWLLKAYIANCRDFDIFYISDPHYDDIDFDDPWVNIEIDKKLLENRRLIKSENDTLSMINQILQIVQTRKKQGLTLKKGIGKIRIFMDEIDSYSSDIQTEISNFIKIVEYEAAKYGVTICLGAHSVKKGEMGIDSSVISSMLNILFPSVILDRNNVLSGSFPTLQVIKKMFERYKIESLPDDGRMVLIADDLEVFPSHIPNLNKEIKIEILDENVDNKATFEKIKNWVENCYQKFNQYPSRDMIGEIWNRESGQNLSQQALDLLLEKLNLGDKK